MKTFLASVLMFAVCSHEIGAQRRSQLPPLPPPPESAPLAAEQLALQERLAGKTVTLVMDAYSISYPGTANGRRTALSEGVLQVSPGRPAAYRFVEIGGPGGLIDLSDSDPNRLLDKVQAARSPLTAATTKLFKYAAGSELKVVGFEWGVRLLKIILDDPSSNVGLPSSVPASAITVLWSERFSSDFRERAQFEEFLAKVFTVK